MYIYINMASYVTYYNIFFVFFFICMLASSVDQSTIEDEVGNGVPGASNPKSEAQVTPKRRT